MGRKRNRVEVIEPDTKDCCCQIYKLLLTKRVFYYDDLADKVGVDTPDHPCLRELTRFCLKFKLPPITALVVNRPNQHTAKARRCEALDVAWYGRQEVKQ